MAFAFVQKKCVDAERGLQMDVQGTGLRGLAVICFHTPGDLYDKKGGYLCFRESTREVRGDEKKRFAPYERVYYCEVERYSATMVHGGKWHPNDCLIDGYDFDETVEIVNEALLAYLDFLDQKNLYAHEVVWKPDLPNYLARMGSKSCL